ncbi:MAG: transglutaminase domain-containing protein [Ginsengibacter sp.]
MNKVLLLFAFSFISTTAKPQSEYYGVREGVVHIPDSLTYSTSLIAGYIHSHFSSDSKMIRAIYSWVVSNIKYDKDSANEINLGVDPEAKITLALKRRRGVCENYAAIFNDICIKAGLPSFVVNGYTKQMGMVDKTGHSWCAVLVNGSWGLYDPTWDESNGMNLKYFMMAPAEFIETHMPYDPIWQLLNKPVTHQQFNSGNIFNNKNQYFNYTDSIAAYMEMDSLHKFKSSAARIQKDALYNSMVRNNNNIIKMNIEMINQDRDVELYNSSVAGINDATTDYNHFVEYRNQQFKPKKSDGELFGLLDEMENKLLVSLKKLDQVDHSDATFILGTEPVRYRIVQLMSRIKEQKDFVIRYTAADEKAREILFYK